MKESNNEASYYYILAKKDKAGLKSGNLSSANFGTFEANDSHFVKLCGQSTQFFMYSEEAKPKNVSDDKILIKVKADPWEIKHVAMSCTRNISIIK